MRIIRKALICMVAVMLLFCAAVTFQFSITTAYAADTGTKFDDINVLDDLQSSKADGKSFDIRNYPFNALGEMQIITFIEYCYSPYANMLDNYGLYLYVYNPQALIINTTSKANTIQMAVAYNADGVPKDYEKFDLKFCSMSTESKYYRLFYKFKVVDHTSTDGKTILQRVNSHERRYDVSGFELHEQGKANPKDYTIGGTFKFTGYSKGYGADQDADSTLDCIVTKLETIELEIKDTFFRPDIASSKGKNYRNQLNSVYFSVDERFFQEYGKLQKIKAEWYEYKTAPILVTDSSEVYNAMFSYRGQKFQGSSPYGWFDRSIPYGFAFEKNSNISGTYYDWNYNHYTMPNYGDVYAHTPAVDAFYYLFYTYGTRLNDYVISTDELTKYIYDYKQSSHKGYLPIKAKTISADLFENAVDSGRTRGYNPNMEFDTDDKFDLLFYDNNHNGWQKFWDFFGKWGIDTAGDFYGKSPIVEVVDNDVLGNDDTISNKLLIDKGNVAAFKDFYYAEKAKTKRVILFRFAQTDYMSQELFIPKGLGLEGNKKGYVAQETVFLSFDIIQLTFNRDGVYTVIPVVADPIDIINPIVSPLSGVIGGCGGFSWQTILMIIALIVLIILLLPFWPIISKVLSWIINGIIWLITAPFKAVKKLKNKKKEA